MAITIQPSSFHYGSTTGSFPYDAHHVGCATPKYKNAIFCANCGGFGHIYKNCNHPVTSYGVICYRIRKNPHSNSIYPEFLMVQRKDSLSYVEFIRGKYSIEKKNYIMKLISNMTEKEREALRTRSFDDLWRSLWQADDCKAYQREYAEARSKFEILKRGYIMKNESNEIYYFDIEYILNNTVTQLTEAEWGFPKGRRNINEPDFACAVREFREETGVHPYNIRIIKNQKPFEEVFSGTNKIRYKHVYYLATYINNQHNKHQTLPINPSNKHQHREIKDVRWFTYEMAQDKIRDYNVERKELFKRVNNVILKNLYLKYNTYHHDPLCA
jgi:8-oxo-dGTP pyrophosphatase MutT (NUDIX family)